MGWRGTLRSIGAAARAAERDEQRRHKLALKEEMVADAAAAVASWETYVRNLVSVHVNLNDAIDWREIANRPRPPEPILATEHKDRAVAALAAFKPGLFDFLGGGTAKRRERLERQTAEAPVRDREDHEAAMTTHRAALAEWEADASLAKRLLAGAAAAIKEVIEEMQTFTDDSLIGARITFDIGERHLHAKPEVHSDEIVPNYRRKQLASGKLSETKMPAGQFNELYQDYVASVALKVAGDLFHIVPLDEVYVTCMATMLNSQTGRTELTPILSVQFVRDTFKRLNLEAVDPSDAMRNFRHVMDFKKAKGFAPITPLEPIASDS